MGQANPEPQVEREPQQQAFDKIDKGFIISRAKEVFTQPKQVWPAIKSEKDSVKGFYIKYLLVMAAIPPICNFIGMVVIGIKIPFIGTFHWPIVQGVVSTIVTYGVGLVFVYIAARIVQFLAAKFEGNISEVDAVKTVGYSLTPGYLGGFISLVPALGVLGILFAFYALYIFYQGLSQMSGVASEKIGKFFALSLLANFLAALVLGIMVASIAPHPPMPDFDLREISDNLNIDAGELGKSLDHFQKAFPKTP